MVRCPNGHQNGDDSEFCVECGAPLPTTPTTPPPASLVDEPAPEPRRSQKPPRPPAGGITLSRAQLIGTGVAGVAILGLIVGLILATRGGSPPAPTTQAAVVTRIVTVIVPQTQTAQVTTAAQDSPPTQPATAAVTVTPSPTPSPAPSPTPPPTPSPSPSPAPSPPPSPTRPPTPLPTPNTTTPAGTVLGVGDTWKQGGLELTLTEQSLALGNSDFQGAYLRFNLTNKRGAEFILSYSQDNFSAVDNLGRPVPAVRVWQRNNGSNFDAVDKKFTGQAVFKPNETVDLPFQTGSVNYYGKDKLLLQADITQTAVTALLVTVTGISGIEGATWRIPINH